MSKLKIAWRASLNSSQFALPEKAKTSKAKKQSGNYPIPDEGHARSALRLVAVHGTPEEKARVRTAVKRKFGIGKKMSVGGLASDTVTKITKTDEFKTAGNSTKESSGSGGNAMGIIGTLYSYVRQLGDAFDKDAAKTDKYGEILNPNKYRTEYAISDLIDPFSKGLSRIEKGDIGNGLLDLTGLGGILGTSNKDIKEAKKAADAARTAEREAETAQANQLEEEADTMAMNSKLAGLCRGGKVYKRLVKGGFITDTNRKRRIPMLKIIKPHVPTTIQVKAKGGVVTGNPGIDTNPANLKEGSFVIPNSAMKGKQGVAIREIAQRLGLYKPLLKRTGGDVPVLLTKGEIVIPPEKKKIFETLIQKKGIPSLQSLAPNADNSSGKDEGGSVNGAKARLKELQGLAKQRALSDEEMAEMKRLKEQSGTDSSENYTGEKVLGALQTAFGAAGVGTLGKAPIVTPEAEKIFNESYEPIGTRLGLAELRKLSYQGLDAKAKTVAQKKINQTYTDTVKLVKETGDPNAVFNETIVAGQQKNDAETNLEVQDSEAMTQNKARYASALIGADPFLASLAEQKKQSQLQLLMAKQGLWGQESEGYAKLINAGMTNIMESDRTGKFWSNYMKYSNPYIGS